MTKVRSVCRTRNSPVWEFSHIAKDTSSQFGTLRPAHGGSNPHEAPWNCLQLTGSIPPELGKLVKLEGLSVYDNDITGCIPTALLERPSLDVDDDDLRER